MLDGSIPKNQWELREYNRIYKIRSSTTEELVSRMPSRRRTVWRKTDGICFYCGAQLRAHFDLPKSAGKTFVAEHYVPISAGGEDKIGNLFPSCHSCNVSKRSFSISEWRKKLSIKSAYAGTEVPKFTKKQKTWLLSQGFTLLKKMDDTPSNHIFWAEKNGWVMTDLGAFQ